MPSISSELNSRVAEWRCWMRESESAEWIVSFADGSSEQRRRIRGLVFPGSLDGSTRSCHSGFDKFEISGIGVDAEP